MFPTESVLAGVMRSVMISAIIRNAPRFLEQFYALRAIADAQPSPAIYYLQQWHNR